LVSAAAVRANAAAAPLTSRFLSSRFIIPGLLPIEGTAGKLLPGY
jgi:hypothetical protein